MSEIQEKTKFNYPILLLAGIVLGSILGLILGPEASVLKPFGDLFMNAMFMIIVPVVFFTISSSMAGVTSVKRLSRILITLLTVFIGTAIIGCIIMLIVVKIVPTSSGIDMAQTLDINPPDSASSTGSQIVNMFTVGDFPELISRKHMLPLIIGSIFFGFSLKMVGKSAKPVVDFLKICSDAVLNIVKLVTFYAPIGLGAYFANIVGALGPRFLGAYGKNAAVVWVTLALYFVIFFSLYAFIAAGKDGVKVFWKNIPTTALTAFGTNSSAATLPVNIKSALKIGIPRDIAEVVLPIGATVHMEGSAMTLIVKLAFLFNLYGKPFEGIETFAIAILVSVLAGVAFSGVPGGGLIGDMLLVNLYGFPLEAFPIVVTLGSLCSPIITMLNASGDTNSSMLIARILDGKEWFKNKVVS